MPFAVTHIREVPNVNSNDRAELEELGWNERFASAFDALDDEDLEPGRLAADYGTKFLVQLAGSAPLATLGSALREARLVAVGDWVAFRQPPQATEIRAVLPRQSAITREAPGSETAAQLIAANVDLVFIATSADTDFNLRRIERLLTVAYQSGAAPVIVLTKVDLNNADPFEAELETIAAGVPVVAVSGRTGAGIDTPGLREIQLWAGAEALAEVFLDIEELALSCRFTDCRHETEPGCAVVAALDGGTLDTTRLTSYRKLQRELRAIEVKADVRLQIEERRKWKVIHKSVKQHMQVKRPYE